MWHELFLIHATYLKGSILFMIVNKIGSQHLELGTNCQDFGLEKDNLKLVCDGCSEGEHSEIGAKTYCYLANLGYTTHEIFEKLINMFGQSVTSIKNFLCFTIVSVIESNEFFKVQYCGDGYIVLEDVNGDIVFEELNDGEYPKYFSYNFTFNFIYNIFIILLHISFIKFNLLIRNFRIFLFRKMT